MVKGKKIACPSCNRKFATSAAMQQHKVAAHGGQNRQPNANVARRQNPPRNRRGNGSVVMSGTDLLVITNVSAGSPAGRALQGLRLSPRSFIGSRLAQLSECWARWRPVSLRVRSVGAGAYTTYGTIALGWTADSNVQMIGASQSNLVRVSSCRPSVEFKLSSSSSMTLPVESSRKWYLTSGVPDDTSHGTLLACVGAITGGYSGQVSLTLHLDWSVMFEGVDLEGDHADDELVRPDAGWDHLFTTSDDSYNSKVLTFKMHFGGSMVAWSAAHPARVYTVAGGTRVPYYNTSNQLAYCSYFAVVQNYQVPGMLLFATPEDATAYIKSGDTAKAIPYTEHCGDHEVTPAVPVLKLYKLSGSLSSDPEVTLLQREVSEMRAQLAALHLVRTEVHESVIGRICREMQHEQRERPSGTTIDPIKVVVEDPIRGGASCLYPSLSDISPEVRRELRDCIRANSRTPSPSVGCFGRRSAPTSPPGKGVPSQPNGQSPSKKF